MKHLFASAGLPIHPLKIEDENGHKINIYMGKGKSKRENSPASKQLPIRCLVYDTLVEGISSATQEKDFEGAMGVNYQLDGENYQIVFAMWFSKRQHMYFLTSLGQYSARHFALDLINYKQPHCKNIEIKLAPIHPAGLTNLAEKLLRLNLSNANVCLVEDTIGAE